MAKEMVCVQCGTKGKPKTFTKGTFLVELGLWLLIIVPGIIYSLWRSSSRYKGCKACGSTNIVPADSPVAMKMA